MSECSNRRVCPNRPGCARAFQNHGSPLTPEPHAAHGAPFTKVPSPDIAPKVLKKGVSAPECLAEHAATIIKFKKKKKIVRDNTQQFGKAEEQCLNIPEKCSAEYCEQA